MSRLVLAMYLALMIAPFLALAATAPFVLIDYRRRRTVHVLRCSHLYLLFFFFLCAYFMTMLPFPSIESVQRMTNSGVQLVPFYCFYDFAANSGLHPSDWTTLFPALGGSIFLGIVFNVIMLLPVGFFLRSLTPYRTWQITLIGLSISLLFELTQLSGLFFIYPRPYRVFDVDDLIQNTLGVWLGCQLQPLLGRLLPSAREKQVVQQGGQISMRRRMLADAVDQGLITLAALLLLIILRTALPVLRELHGLRLYPLAFSCYLALSPFYALLLVHFNGRSPGGKLAGLQLRSQSGKALRFLPCLLRQMVYGCILSLPLWIACLIDFSTPYAGLRSVLFVLLSALCAFLYVLNLLSIFLHVVTHGAPLLHDRISGTHLGFDPDASFVRKQSALFIGVLGEKGIEPGVKKVFSLLSQQGIERKKCLRVQFMVEGVLLEWMNSGLHGSLYVVQMEKRFHHRTLLISVPGRRVPLTRNDDSYVEVLSGTRLSFDAYYTGGVNVFAIEVP